MKILKFFLAAILLSSPIKAEESIKGFYIYVHKNNDPKNAQLERLEFISESELLYTLSARFFVEMQYERHGDFLLATLTDTEGKHIYPIYKSPDGSLHMAGKNFIKGPGKLVTDPKTKQQTCSLCGAKVFIATPGATTKEATHEFAARSRILGIEDWEKKGWLRCGAFCPNGCIFETWNLLPAESTTPAPDSVRS